MTSVEVRGLVGEEVDRGVDVLADAFTEYPVMRHVIGDAGDAYADRLRRLMQFFVTARVLQGDPVLGIVQGPEVLGCATVTPTRAAPPPGDLDLAREETWAALGASARARYEALGEAWQGFSVDEPHHHLNMIGVPRNRQGEGLGRRLLDAVQQISRDDAESIGVTLTTEDPRNVPMYEHLGYEIIGHVQLGPGLASWGFLRRD